MRKLFGNNVLGSARNFIILRLPSPLFSFVASSLAPSFAEQLSSGSQASLKPTPTALCLALHLPHGFRVMLSCRSSPLLFIPIPSCPHLCFGSNTGCIMCSAVAAITDKQCFKYRVMRAKVLRRFEIEGVFRPTSMLRCLFTDS
jgi:hypothetical protein